MSRQPLVRDVLGAIVGDSSGLVEMRAFGGPGAAAITRCFASLSDVSTLAAFVAQNRATLDVYFGVATRRDATSGSAENCLHLGALFVDVDFKDADEATLRGCINDSPLSPSIVIFTGGGLHLYYLLDQPQPATALKPLLRRLARYVSGDLAAAEPARILRVPGTLNHKHRPPVLVRIEQFEPTRRYALADFDDVLPEEPFVVADRSAAPVFLRGSRTGSDLERLNRGRAYLRAMGPAIEGCGGDAHTYKAAAWLVCDLALDDSDALSLLSEWNHTCSPPWSEGELWAKIRHARRYGTHAVGGALLADVSSRVFTVRVQVP